VCNQWTSRIGSWLPAGAWQACASDAPPQEGSRVWVGLDVGGSRGDTAVAFIDKELRVGCAIFTGEDAIFDAHAFVAELAERYAVANVSFDPWHAAEIARDLEQRGLRTTVFPQTERG
jgi:phage terminase large subunit-like protein